MLYRYRSFIIFIFFIIVIANSAYAQEITIYYQTETDYPPYKFIQEQELGGFDVDALNNDEINKTDSQRYYQQQRSKIFIIFTAGILSVSIIFVLFQLYIRHMRRNMLYGQELSNSIVDNAGIIIAVLKLDGSIVVFNKYAKFATGYSKKDVYKKKWVEFILPEEKCFYIKTLYNRILQGEKVQNLETQVLCKDGSCIDVLWNSNILYNFSGQPMYIVSMGVDITESKRADRKLMESYEQLEVTHEELVATKEELKQQFEEVRKMAYYDNLTGLPNRRQFMENLSQVMKKVKSKNNKIALFFLDLDNFKIINDTVGHVFGDILLKNVGKRLKEHLSECDIIARLGGDEYVLMKCNLTDNKQVSNIADKILKIFKNSWYLERHEFYITTSVGITVYPDDGTDVQTLLKNADTAMYKAKEMGRKNYKFFNKAMNIQIIEKLNMENSLRHAVEKQEFELYYQPQIDIKTNKIVGLEALIRWVHPTMGIVLPMQFIPLAEETGLIIPIGEWVLRTACVQIMKLMEKGYNDVNISINLSVSQFMQQNMVETIADIVKETGINPKQLELEITESIAMYDLDFAIKVLNKIRDMGIKVALDDFGTGYSSLNYLKLLPINTLKIDKSFVHDIAKGPNEAAIVKAVIELAHNMDLTVTAEGVETKKQLEFLRKENCETAQGFLFSKPMSYNKIENLMKNWYSIL